MYLHDSQYEHAHAFSQKRTPSLLVDFSLDSLMYFVLIEHNADSHIAQLFVAKSWYPKWSLGWNSESWWPKFRFRFKWAAWKETCDNHSGFWFPNWRPFGVSSFQERAVPEHTSLLSTRKPQTLNPFPFAKETCDNTHQFGSHFSGNGLYLVENMRAWKIGQGT